MQAAAPAMSAAQVESGPPVCTGTRTQQPALGNNHTLPSAGLGTTEAEAQVQQVGAISHIAHNW